MPSQVASYNDDDLIGTDATTADANFDQAHPLYAFARAISPRSRPTTRRCATARRSIATRRATAGIYAFSRIDPDERDRVRRRAQQRRDGEDAGDPDVLGRRRLQRRCGRPASAALTTNGVGPADGHRAAAVGGRLPRRRGAGRETRGARASRVAAPAEGATVVGQGRGRRDVSPIRSSPRSRSRSRPATRPTGRSSAPTTTRPTASSTTSTGLAAGHRAPVQGGRPRPHPATSTPTPARPSSARSSRRRAVARTPRLRRRPLPAAGRRLRRLGLPLLGRHRPDRVDVDEPVAARGRGRVRPRSPGSSSAERRAGRVHRPQGRREGPWTRDRFFDPSQTPGDLAQAGDPTVYTSRAAAQGYVEIRYQRPDGDYTGWGLHLWGDAIAPGVGHRVDGAATARRDRRLRRLLEGPDPGRRRSPSTSSSTRATRRTPADATAASVPTEKPAAWLQSGDDARSTPRAAPPRTSRSSTTTAPTATTATRPRRTSTTSGASTSWDGPASRIRSGRADQARRHDRLRPVLQGATSTTARPSSPTSSTAATRRIPARTSHSTWSTLGHEVWYLSGHADADQMAKYLLPIQAGRASTRTSRKPKAHWLTENTIAWDIEPLPGGDYASTTRRPAASRSTGGRHRRARRSRSPASRAASRPSSRRSGRTSPTTRRSASPPGTSTGRPRR